jgi:hypothetical protein
MSSFLDQMAIHAQIRRLQEKGCHIEDAAPEQYVRGLLLTSPPFASSSSETIRDLHLRTAGEVPCPQREHLVNTLSEFLVLQGLMYDALIGRPSRALRLEVQQAERTMRQVLKKFYPERRHKKVWLAYEDVASKIAQIPHDHYRQLRPDLRRQWLEWKRELAHRCFWVFRHHFPSRTAYVDDAIDHALAAIFIHLEIEPDEGEDAKERLVWRIKKDREATRNAELRESYFAPDPSIRDEENGERIL